MATGANLEPELFTFRTLTPALSFFLHPYLAFRAMEGEMKGSDTALALLENRPVQMYPFYAVLDSSRPSAENCRTPFIHLPPAASSSRGYFPGATGLGPGLHVLSCRLSGGFYHVERNPLNNKWRVF